MRMHYTHCSLCTWLPLMHVHFPSLLKFSKNRFLCIVAESPWAHASFDITELWWITSTLRISRWLPLRAPREHKPGCVTNVFIYFVLAAVQKQFPAIFHCPSRDKIFYVISVRTSGLQRLLHFFFFSYQSMFHDCVRSYWVMSCSYHTILCF